MKPILFVFSLLNISSLLGFGMDDETRDKRLKKSLMGYRAPDVGTAKLRLTDQAKLPYYQKLWKEIRLLLENKQIDPDLKLSELDQFRLNFRIRKLINSLNLIGYKNELVVKYLLKQIVSDFARELSIESIEEMPEKQRLLI